MAASELHQPFLDESPPDQPMSMHSFSRSAPSNHMVPSPRQPDRSHSPSPKSSSPQHPHYPTSAPVYAFTSTAASDGLYQFDEHPPLSNGFQPIAPQGADADLQEIAAAGARFAGVRTIPLALFNTCIIILNEVQIWMASWLDHEKDRFLLTQAGLFALLSFSYLFIFRYEHQRLQLRGYLEFYQKANGISRFIFFIAALFCCTVSVLFAFFGGRHIGSVDTSLVLSIIISAETGALIIAHVLYMRVCAVHNQNESLPDAHSLYDLPPSLATPVLQSNSPKQTNPNSLIKKQANLIRYLEDKVKSLSQELLRAKQSAEASGVSAVGNAAGSANWRAQRNELEQVLSSKDQEIRALRVDRDKIKKENKRNSEQLSEMQTFADHLRQDNVELIAQIDLHKETISKQAAEINRLLLLLEVQKEATAVSRKTIEEYERRLHN